MTRQTKRRNNHGFTLAETLLVVGILVVLFALAMIPITKMQRDIRQTELDSKAEVVFMAAQNRLTQLQAAGQMSAYNENYTAKLGLQPIDAESGKYSDDDLVYVTSKEKGDSSKAAAWILPESRLEADLWNADWVVEYDPASASVYAVFYSEKDMNYEPTGFNMLRARDTRLSRGAKVGYYGGDSVATKDTDELTPQFEIVNGERLLLTGSCDMAMLAELKFYVTLEDESGHVTDAITLKSPEVKLVGSTYNVEMVLDDLTEKDNMRFAEQTRFKDKTSGAHLVPGEQLKITVKVVSASSQVGTAVSTLETNSLFAAVADQRQRRSGAEGRTATVSCARHLQNLDKDSGVTDTTGRNTATVNAAVQDQDILFVSTTDDGWDSCYPGQTFTPIDNTNLTSYDATLTVGETSVHPVIYDLPVETDGDAGLFAALNSTAELHHICLAGAQISGKGNVGAMIGATKGKLTIDHCQVLLSQLKGHVNGKNETDVWISGATVGGLVGEITSGTVTVENSFAASVLSGTDRAGGLIGNIAGAAVTVKNSYADCYLYSDASTGRTGGLVGGYKDTSSLNMENCYAAGFQQASTTAGLVADALYTGDSVSNTYTACAPLAGEQLTFSTTVKPTDAVSPKFSKVFYLCTAETDMAGTSFVNASQWTGANNRAAAAELLGDAFTAETGGTNTVPYNLMENMGLGAYSYPKLKDIPHYGDWQTEFESGSLAYYEYYADKSYGFYGGGLSTLDNTKTVLGDGYGVVYEGSVPEAPSVKDADGNAVTLQTAQKIVSGEKTYYLLPLPAEMVNTGAPGSTYYRQVQVEGVPYYYNPHFARSVTTGTTMPDAPDEIYIRTARQLNNLSLYYDQYSKMLSANAGFLQGRSIDYASYDWKNFGLNGTAVKEQQPIGRSEAQPFRHTYNGGRYEITGISFLTRDNDRYTGMFGYNTGSLSNIALTGDDERTAGISVAVQRMTARSGRAGRMERRTDL